VVREQRGPVDRPSPYEQASLALRAVAPLAGGPSFRRTALLFRDERERGTAFSAIRTKGADASLRLVGRRWSLLGYVQTRDFYNSFASVNAARTAVTGVPSNMRCPRPGSARASRSGPASAGASSSGSAATGARHRANGRAVRLRRRRGTRAASAGGRSATLGAFSEASWTGENLTAHRRRRLDRWAISGGFLREHVLATGAVLTDTGFPDRSGWEPTGRAGLAWRSSGGLTLRGAAYLGWRLPTLNELYRPFRVGADATAANAALDPSG
jgi:hypothetical protein